MAGNRNSYNKRNIILDILIVIVAIALVFLFLQMRKQDNIVAKTNTQIAENAAVTETSAPEETVIAAQNPAEPAAETTPEAQPEVTPAAAENTVAEPETVTEETKADTAQPEEQAPQAETEPVADPKDATEQAEIVEEVVVQTAEGEQVELRPAEADEAPVVAVAPVVLTPEPTEEPKVLGSLRVAVLGGMFSAFGTQDAYYPDGEVIQESEMWWSAALADIPYEILSVVNASSVGTAYSLESSDEKAPWLEERVEALGASGDPNLILVMVGEEDPAFGESGLASANETEQTLLQSPATTARGAALTLQRVTARWPEARVVVLIPPETDFTKYTGAGMTLQRFNWAMNEVDDTARQMGIEVIDLRDCALSTDGLYPTMADMKKMAKWAADQLSAVSE